MIKAVLFDFFGVINSEAIETMIGDHKLGDEDAGAIRALLVAVNKNEMTSEEYRESAAKIFGLSVGDYRAELDSASRTDMEMVNYIAELRKRVKAGILSNVSGTPSLQKRFTAGDLSAYFDTVVASGDIGIAKPEVRAYQVGAENLGVKPEACVFVDDKQEYCDAAVAAGMQAILYKSFEQFRTDLEKLLQQ
jgi:epoxide hydrolase-like predicted phosphatase